MAEVKKPTKARAPHASALRSTAPVAVIYASKYTVGNQISHAMFGDGTVTEVDVNRLTIEFPDSGIKEIIDDYVKRRQL
jgi:hypothetical protein